MSEENAVKSNHDAATAAQNEMADVVATVKAILAKTTDSVDGARRGFYGQAAVAFNAVANEWDLENKNLNDRLDEVEKQVGVGVASFRNLEAENEGGFKQLTNL
ncbi:WXG100 family type VII secretion target [Nocardia sp. NPDC055321]